MTTEQDIIKNKVGVLELIAPPCSCTIPLRVRRDVPSHPKN